MDFGTALKTCFAKYATFHGRAARSEYWWFALFGLITGLITVIIDTSILGRALDDFLPVTTILNVALFLPFVSVGIRRLHDLDKTGWWIAPYVALSVIDEPLKLAKTSIYKWMFDQGTVVGLLYSIPMFIFCIVYLVWSCTRGTVGPNKYGEDPLPAAQAGPSEPPIVVS